MNSEFHSHNRQLLTDKLQGGVVVLSAYSAMQRSNDAAFAFEQESNFWYLTGIEKPDWWVIIDGSKNKTWMVSPDLSEVDRIFNGGLSHEEAAAISGANSVINHEEAIVLLRDLARAHGVVYSLADPPSAVESSFIANPADRLMWRRLERTFQSVRDIRADLNKLRAVKQPAEIKAIKQAVKLTSDAFSHVKNKLPDLQYEYQVEAEFSHFFRSRGARGHAYDPIIASGKNACTLHYCDNSNRMKSGQMVLMDVGVRLNGYAADITRTYAHGKVSGFAKDMHTAVSQAHSEIIKLLKPGLSVVEYQNQVDEIMKQALIDLKLIKTKDDDQGYRRYFPHAISHGLGIDVHDSLGRPDAFLPGMVLTVEPGIYIPEKGLGVRIEDDILITEVGHENMSRSLSTDL